MSFWMIALAPLGLASVAHAECGSVDKTLDNVMNAIIEDRLDEANAHLEQAEVDLSCGPLVETGSLARLWLLEGAVLSLRGEPLAAGYAFMSAHITNPDGWDPDLGTQLEAEYRRAAEKVGGTGLATISLSDSVAEQKVALDGLEAAFPLKAHAGYHLLQIMSKGDNAVLARRLLVLEGESIVVELGELPRPGETNATDGSGVGVAGSSRGRALWMTSGASVLLGGSAFALALAQNRSMDGAGNMAELDEAYRRQKMWSTTSYGLLGLGVVGGVVAFAF